MEDLAALRDHYKAELRAKLEVKVARQRKEREERKALEEAEQRKLKEKERLSYNFRIRRPKSSAADDKMYLKNIRFSKYYVINEIKNQLEKSNELDRKYKSDEFYEIIHSPNVLDVVEKEIIKGKAITFEKLKKIIQIIKEKEEMVQHMDSDMVRGAVGGIRQAKLDPMKEKTTQGAENSDITFPVIKYPDLKIVNRSLESPEPCHTQVDSLSKMEKKRQDTEKRKRLLQRMYRVSQSYEAATNRILKKYKKWNFQEIDDAPDAKDIFAYYSKTTSLNEEKDPSVLEQKILMETLPDETEVNMNIRRYLRSLNDLLLTDEPLESTHQNRAEEKLQVPTKSNPSSASGRSKQNWEGRFYSDEGLRKEILGISAVQREPQILAPLTMKAVEETAKVKIIKEPDLWINPEQ